MCNIAVVGQESISGVYAERGIAKFDIKTFFIYTFTDYLEKKKTLKCLLIEKMLSNFLKTEQKFKAISTLNLISRNEQLNILYVQGGLGQTFQLLQI